ncbi:MAG: helix-turn-helix transcriptional regulator [Oscillospiraceae bacterium]|jgi:putative transcriptional regulator|nr:helix-turn-helix transcriptional regulator [Oscillospiraceae bacterium]
MSDKERGSCPLKRRKTDPKFRNRLRVARAELEISQGELAARAGTSRQTICAIEKGNFNPTAPLAMKLCQALGKTFEELFYMED